MAQLNLKTTINPNGSVTASWSSIPGAIRYQAHMYEVGKTYMMFNEPNLKTTSYTSEPNLEVNKHFKLTVAAFDASKHLASEAKTVVLNLDFYNNTPLEIPKNIQVSVGAVSATVRFDPVPRASSYDVLFGGTVYSVTNTIKEITRLKPNTKYSYSVRAKNSSKTGQYSPEKTITTLAQNPPSPTGIQKKATESSVTINWSLISGVTSYELLFDGRTYFPSGSTYTLYNLTPGKSYQFQIRAKKDNLYSSYSTMTTVTTAPNKPSSINAVSNEDSVTMNWTQSVGATGYIIRFSGMDYHCGTTPLTSTYSTLKPDTLYTYQICAKSADGVSAYTASKSIKTAPSKPMENGVTSSLNSVTISWNPSPGAISYDVFFDGKTYNVKGTSKTFTGLSPGTSYKYAIRSNNSGGSSTYSDEKTVMTNPSVPTGIAAAISDDSVTISWNPVVGATSYDVTINGTTYNVSGTSHTLRGLPSNTLYRYQVCARNANGTSTATESDSVKTAPKAPFAKTTIMTADSAYLNWDQVSGASSYDLLFGGVTYRVTGVGKTIDGLTPGTSYHYQIRTNNAYGSSAYSPVKTVMTIPDTPSNVRATAAGYSITVSWDAVRGATGYDLYLDSNKYEITSPSIKIDGLIPQSLYWYKVCAKNTGGASAYTQSQPIKTLQVPPTVPEKITASATATTVTVSWRSTEGATGYDVIFNGATYSLTQTYKTFTGLTPQRNYSYQVRAKNEVGASVYSPAKVVATLQSPPAAPTSVIATATTNTITVNWGGVSGATSYEVRLGGTVYPATGTSKTITGLIPGTEYTYQVRAGNAAGFGAYSTEKIIQTKKVMPEIPTGINAVATADSADISWYVVRGATSYNVLFNHVEYQVSDPAKTITDLMQRTTYTYQVRANNEIGSSAYSQPLTVRTLIGIPQDIKATADVFSVNISFSPLPGATSYDIRFNGVVHNITDTTKEFTELMPETDYTYSVRAHDESGPGAFSKPSTIKTLEDVPEVPSNVTASATLNTVKVSWDNAYKATSFDVEFDGNIYRVNKNKPKGRATSQAKIRYVKVFRGLNPNTNHTYCVRANSERGSSAYSPLRTITTKKSKKNGLPNVKSNRKYQDGRVPHMGLDPVNALTGAFLWSYTYLEDYGKDSLHFTAMYDSQRDEAHRTLGNKWTYSLQYRLYMDSEYVYFSTPYDEVTPFAIDLEHNKFQLPEDVRSSYQMERREDGIYCIKDADDMEYLFDSSLSLLGIKEGGLMTYRFTADDAGQIVGITSRYGAKLTLIYNDGHIERVTDDLGNTVSFIYREERLISAENSDGKSMIFTYDEEGNLVAISDYAGNTHLTNEYDSESRVIMQNTAGRGTTYASYDEENKTTVFTDELGNNTTYTYDANLNVTGIQLSGINVKNKYTEGQLAEQTDGLGNTTVMTYDESGRMNSIVYPDGTTESVLYNLRNNPVKMTNRDGTNSTYEYDEKNNLLALWEERGYKCSFVYDDRDNLISSTDKNGNLWTYSYDDKNHLVQETDPAGNSSRYSHDAIGRLLSYTTPMGLTTTYEYSAAGDLIRIVDGDGTTSFEYDDNGNQTAIIDRMGNRRLFTYQEMGQVSGTTDFMGNKTAYTYDKRGKLIKETDPLGYSNSYAYDALGNQIAWTDAGGGTTRYTFNAASQVTQVTDAMGNTVSYTYDTMGRVQVMTDQRHNQTSYNYDTMGRITGIQNPLSHTVSYTYDQAGNVLTQSDENGTVTQYSYDKESRVTAIQNDLGTIQFTYDSLGRVIEVLDLDGYTEKTEYDADGKITGETDKEGNKTTYAYNSTGHLAEETAPNGGKTTYEYDKNGNCIKITDACGNSSNYSYDANGSLTKETNPLGYETVYTYDARGCLTSVTDALGRKTVFEYDGNENIVKETNPDNGTRVYTYDALNRLTKVVDEEENSWSYVYDACGNRIAYTDANQNKWTYTYDALSRLSSVTDQTGGAMLYEYLKTGEIAKITDQEGTETNYQYDAMGRLILMSDGLDNHMSFAYDKLGRVTMETDAAGNTKQYKYSPNGNLLESQDGENNATVYTYDALGQIIEKKDALSNVTVYTYDALSQVIAIKDALGAETTFTYTPTGKIASVTDPNGGCTTYEYDACGNLQKTTDSLGNQVIYEYDSQNNQIKEYLSASGEQAAITLYDYDKKSRMVREINPLLDEKTYTYDGNGNVTAIHDEDGIETAVRYDLNNKPIHMRYSDGKEAAFRYNKRGELVELTDWNGTVLLKYGKTGRLASVQDHNQRKTDYGYDANGNVTSITYPDGSKAAYTYDKNNRVSTVTDAEEQITRYERDKNGTVISISQPGNTTTYTHNKNGQPVNIKYQLADGTFMENNIAYDPAGNIISEEKKGSTPALTKSAAYTYDALGQLLSYRDGSLTERYSYDALGNRLTKERNGICQASYRYNPLNQLTAKTEQDHTYQYTYDKRGNLTEEKRNDSPVRQYTYDATGHMTTGRSLETGESTQYGYNALYMRVKNKKTLNNIPSRYRSHAGTQEKEKQPELFRTKETDYCIDYLSPYNNELITYEKGFGATRTTYGPGYERLSQKVTAESGIPVAPRGIIATQSIGKAHFQSDQRSSVLFASNTKGEALRYAERDPWGSLRLPASEDLNLAGLERLGYTSYEYDQVIGSSFAQARFYDGGHGRMLGKDPVKRGLNAYPYCGNNPVNRVDPTGEVANVLAGAFLGGLSGGVFGFAGSAFSQWASGEDFSLRKALGSAANGAVVGAVRGALVSTGAGIPAALFYDFAAGTAGSALEQQISKGSIDVRESVTSGITNAVSGMIYGNKPLSSTKNAFRRGAMAGGATAAINNLSNAFGKRGGSQSTGGGGRGRGSYTIPGFRMRRDPRGGCGNRSPFTGMEVYSKTYGYEYGTSKGQTTKQGGFNLVDFGKDVLIGAMTGGMSSAGFYKAGKFVENVRRSVKGGSSPQNYFPKDADGNPIPLAKQRVNGQDIPLPDSKAQGPHTVIGGKISSETGLPYRQSATFPEGTWPTANGKNVPWSEVHWGDHGKPYLHGNPHQHIINYIPEKGGWYRQKPTNFYY